MISKFFQLLGFISSLVYLAISDEEYVNFTSSTDATQSFTGLTGKIILSSDVDVAVSFGEATSESSLIIQGEASPVTIDAVCKTLYAKGVSGSGRLNVKTQNFNTGKSDDEIRLESRMQRRL